MSNYGGKRTHSIWWKPEKTSVFVWHRSDIREQGGKVTLVRSSCLSQVRLPPGLPGVWNNFSFPLALRSRFVPMCLSIFMFVEAWEPLLLLMNLLLPWVFFSTSMSKQYLARLQINRISCAKTAWKGLKEFGGDRLRSTLECPRIQLLLTLRDNG